MHFEKVILFGSFDDKDPKLTALFYSFLFIYISFCTFFFWTHSHNWMELGRLALYTGRCYRLSVQSSKTNKR